MSTYDSYVLDRREQIISTVSDMKCQPILFIGSGLSQRYFDGPSWKELLEDMAERCPEFTKDIDYFLQRGDSYPEIGSKLADAYYDWAWGDGESRFPDRLFDPDIPSDIYMKHELSTYFDNMTPEDGKVTTDQKYSREIDLLKQIQPHSIITTNYDQFLEGVFPDYRPVIGEEILTSEYESVGEILKIHGCVSKPDSLILTESDYTDFNQRKKYLSAKLLTYFAEHPVLIAGYSAEDQNIRRILSDIDEIITKQSGSVDNIYFLNRLKRPDEESSYPTVNRIDTVDEQYIEVNQISAKEWDWVYHAFGAGGSIEGVNLKLLRTVLANTYDIVREKAPKKEVKINYQSLERAANSEEGLGTLFGVTTLDSAPDINILYRYRLTEVGQELGYDSWHQAHYLIEDLEEEAGYNIKQSENKYHIDISVQSADSQHRYSDAAIELLRKVRDDEEYELDLSNNENK